MTETNYNKTIKELHDAMQSSDEYITKSICEGKKVIALDKNTGLIFIFDFFKGNYEMDFLTKECVDTIVTLVQDKNGEDNKNIADL
jgi:hypothetical protein